MSTVNGDVLYDEYGEITQCSFNAELLAGTRRFTQLAGAPVYAACRAFFLFFRDFSAGVFHKHIDKMRKKTYAYI